MRNADPPELEATSQAPAEPPRPPRRALGRPALSVLALTAVACGVLAAVMVVKPAPARPAIDIPLPAFSLTSERGEAFSRDTLRGKVWVADFIFTTCPTVCPRLTQRMATLQDRTRDLGDAFHLVSFTVDPENDTPDKLLAYAREHHADPARWTYVTGPLSAIEPTVIGGFKMMMGKRADPDTGLLSVFHGEKLVLVDASGSIRGFYDADLDGGDAGLDALERDARALVKQR